MENRQTDHPVAQLLRGLTENIESATIRWELVPKHFALAPPQCQKLWAEVTFCFVFGQYFAALAVCGAFVEYFLETAIPAFCKRNGRAPVSVPDKFYAQIKLAREVGLISQQQEQMLQDFRQIVRNRFDHADMTAVANSLMSIRSVGEAYVENGEVKIRPVSAEFTRELEQLTVAERSAAVTQKLAPRVIQWIGIWAGDCSREIWGPPRMDNSSS